MINLFFFFRKNILDLVLNDDNFHSKLLLLAPVFALCDVTKRDITRLDERQQLKPGVGFLPAKSLEKTTKV